MHAGLWTQRTEDAETQKHSAQGGAGGTGECPTGSTPWPSKPHGFPQSNTTVLYIQKVVKMVNLLIMLFNHHFFNLKKTTTFEVKKKKIPEVRNLSV